MKPIDEWQVHSSMSIASSPATKRKPTIGEALEFVDQGRKSPPDDLRTRVQAFYRRHPLRTVRRGERGIVESLKTDRDRR
jgi:hypothetical protein